ncbi:MAG: porin [Alphaproteobacteria bacterium]
MNKLLLATSALAVSFAGAAMAVEVEMYGQVNKALMYTDNGETGDFSVVDNALSSTRMGVKGSQALDNGLTVSLLLEGEMVDQASSSLAPTANTGGNSTAPTDATASTWSTRHARVGVAGNWGAAFIGRQSTAADSVAEQDMAGVADLMSSDAGDMAGGFDFYTAAGVGSGNTLAGYADNFDDSDRSNSVRYDSPIFSGLQGRISASQGGDAAVAAYYSGAYDAFKIKGAVGYEVNGDRAPNTANTALDTTVAGSLTVKHDSGIAGTVAYGEQDVDGTLAGANVEGPSMMYGKVGYAWDAFEVAAEMGSYEDITVGTNSEASLMGLGGQYNLADGVSVAAMYRNVDLEQGATDFEDLSIFAMNLRVKF